MTHATKPFRFAIAALLFGASVGMLAVVVLAEAPAVATATQPAAALVVVDTPAPTPAPQQYIEITGGCNHAYEGTCATVFYAPNSASQSATTLRNGVVLKIQKVIATPEGTWYKVVFDEWLRYPSRVTHEWYIQKEHARLLKSTGIQTLSDTTATSTKKIIIDRSDQTLEAYDGDTFFMRTTISTGLDLTPTPRGTFTIFKKTPTRYMQGPLPGISQQYYDVPGVPWTLYFTHQGGAIHGAYWHNGFGTQWSHGCVNVPLQHAEALYEWADLGTTVIVRD